MLLHVVLRQKLLFPEYVMEKNGTKFNVSKGTLSLVISLFLNSFLQFIINVTPASLLINSLKIHIQKMQRNSTGFWNSWTEAHVDAVKLMGCFLLLYIPYTVATLFQYFLSVEMDLGTRSMYIIISTFYIPGHSVLIVLTYPKLKSKAKKIICFNKQWNISSKQWLESIYGMGARFFSVSSFPSVIVTWLLRLLSACISGQLSNFVLIFSN